MGNCLASESRNGVKRIPGIAYTIEDDPEDDRPLRSILTHVPETETITPMPNEPQQENVDPYVQRIADEIAEFREQLRRGQEQIQAMSNSVQSFDTTKSCPGLVELKETQTVQHTKPIGVTIATQTENTTAESIAQTQLDESELLLGPDGTFHDEFMETYEILDEADLDNRFRLRGCALSVIEESEHESELSPGALHRKMNSGRGGRPKLIRMQKTLDEPLLLLPEEDIKSDLDYLSAASSLSGSKNPSLYNSLERPLHVRGTNGNGTGDEFSDTYSTVSGGNTTYGSPISSPSSPTYLTPSQGSSSQETLTNHDGDKTPINFEDLLEDSSSPRPESALRSGNSSRTSNRKVKKSTWQTLPMENRQGTSSIGIIPDEDQEHMRQYAYDVPLRSSDPDAAILSRKDWRTLHSDLDQVDMAKFKKSYGEDDTVEGEFTKSSPKTDLDEVAEHYCEQFPFLAETIFEYLDLTAQERVPSVDELPDLKKRFEELATTFRTDHEKLEGRSELAKNEYESAQRRIFEITSSLKQTAQKIHSEKLPSEIRESFRSIENLISEIDLQTKSLDRTAKRSGRLDVVRRVYKMIEVMVLYVRILNTVCGNLEEESKLARQMLEERGIDFPSKKVNGNAHMNNNNHDKVGKSEYLRRGSITMLEEGSDTDTSHVLQRLLAPKQKLQDVDSNYERFLRRPEPHHNFLSRIAYETYETVLREFHWPWDAEETWGGIRKTFAILLMLFGILLICRISFITPCESTESMLTFSHIDFPRI